MKKRILVAMLIAAIIIFGGGYLVSFMGLSDEAGVLLGMGMGAVAALIFLLIVDRS